MEDINIVEIWLRRDRARWCAGALAGSFASVVALVFSGILAVMTGREFWFPVKLGAIPFMGNSAMALGLSNITGLLLGFVFFQVLCSFLGTLYAHFTGTNSLPALTGVGVTWGAFSWIFLNNLYGPSFREFYVAGAPKGLAFLSCMVFGLSLTSVAFFDRMCRKK